MIDAFWDSSSLVPLCVTQAASEKARDLVRKYSFVAWWGTSIEIASAIQRLTRTGDISQQEGHASHLRRKKLIKTFRTIHAEKAVLDQAEAIVLNHPLKAADAIQLAAATVWTMLDPVGSTFISGDRQVLAVAKELGFNVIQC